MTKKVTGVPAGTIVSGGLTSATRVGAPERTFRVTMELVVAP
jgi:hypothetical protein